MPDGIVVGVGAARLDAISSIKLSIEDILGLTGPTHTYISSIVRSFFLWFPPSLLGYHQYYYYYHHHLQLQMTMTVIKLTNEPPAGWVGYHCTLSVLVAELTVFIEVMSLMAFVRANWHCPKIKPGCCRRAESRLSDCRVRNLQNYLWLELDRHLRWRRRQRTVDQKSGFYLDIYLLSSCP